MKSGYSRFLNLCCFPSAAFAVMLLLTSVPIAHGAITLYSDSFETYPAASTAPNPLTNGPAGGQWYFVDPVDPLTASEHQILNVGSAGAGFYSRVWASTTNNARLTNAISVSALPAGPGPYTFRLTFLVAADTFTTTRNVTFNYAISSTAGPLTFVSGANRDNSQTFNTLSGTGIASAGTIGKSDDRRFEFVFQSSTISTADKIIFDITRVTNNAGATLNMLLDDVRLSVDDAGGPQVQSLQPILTLQHVRVLFTEPVDPATATNAANYAISVNPLPIFAATLVDPFTVELFTSDQAPGSSHTLQISGVKGQTGISMVSTQLNFTAPALTISPTRYDAGTTVTQPSGPPDPVSPGAGYWALTPFSNPGLSVGGVTDDNGTGFNAWNVTDQTTLAGTPNYVLPITPTSSGTLAQSNGWRIVVRSRFVDNFGSTAGDQVILFFNPGVRYGLFWGVDVNGNLYVNPVTGNTYTVASGSDVFNYHTNMMVYNPVTKAVACYFDGRLLTDSYTGQALAGSGITFGAASTAGKGGMNYNLVQLDVVSATAPVVLQNPASSTNGVGQKVTFTANFSPFVNAFQWLSNGVLIAGATTTNYTTPFIDSTYNGVQYKCRALSALGNVETAAAVLTVTSDVIPPFVISAKASLLRDRITLVYSEPVLEPYATNIANYIWVNAGVTNISAQLLDPLTVELRGGPFVAGSNYTVNISNVRDTSNLIITNNSPANMIFPYLSTRARYDAGTTVSSPSGPPDPTSPAGGNWVLSLNTDPDLSTNAVVDDLGSGWNAWQIRDASIVTARFASYNLQVATNIQVSARQFGWVLTVRSRNAENFGTAGAMFAFYEDDNLNRYGLSFNVNANNDLVVGNSSTSGFVDNVVTSDGSGQDYHLHQVVYNPLNATGSYYCDGRLIAWNFPVSNPAASVSELMWGARSSAGKGTMNFNLVDFSSVDGPIVSLTVIGGSAQVSYRGVLERASQLNSPVVWTPVATNLTSSASVYFAPASGQQYFRARQP